MVRKHKQIHSESSDAARRGIMKLYSYETPLYDAVNRANQCRDKRAISTLGPYALALHLSINDPPKTNVKKQEEMADIFGFIMLYRGLGLPEKAIQVYHAYRESGE